MAKRKYSEASSKKVQRALHKEERGTLKSGKDGKGGTVKSKKQAIAIALSEARAEGKKVPAKKTSRRKAPASKKSSTKKKTIKKKTTRKSGAKRGAKKQVRT